MRYAIATAATVLVIAIAALWSASVTNVPREAHAAGAPQIDPLQMMRNVGTLPEHRYAEY